MRTAVLHNVKPEPLRGKCGRDVTNVSMMVAPNKSEAQHLFQYLHSS
jgi:hypothetical protein